MITRAVIRILVAAACALALALGTTSSTVVAGKKAERVKNVILFIGDGMHLEHEIATSRYLYGRDYAMAWHLFPKSTFVSTWDITTYNRRASFCSQDGLAGVAPSPSD